MRTDNRTILAVGLFGRGPRIRERIESLMSRRGNLSSRACSRSVSISLLALSLLTLGGALVPRWIALADSAPSVSFDVASIRINTSGEAWFNVRIAPGGRLHAVNATLQSLITTAYEKPDVLVVGGPSWMNSMRFDIEAKGSPQIPDQILQELKRLLADRFKLVARMEMREQPVYALVTGRSGPKLKTPEQSACFDATAGVLPPPTAPGGLPIRPCGGFNNMTGQMYGAAAPLSRFAANLTRVTGNQ